MARVVLVGVLLAFGGLAFLAGLMAPAGWKDRTEKAWAPVQGLLGAASPASAASAASAPASAALAGAAATPASQAWVPREQLWAAAAPASGASYALLAAQFPSASTAQALAAQLRQQGQDVTVLAVQDADAQPSWVVAVGRYPSSAAAYADAQAVATRLDLSPSLASLVLPAPASAATPAK